MTTFTAFTTLADRDAAEALEERLEDLEPAPYGTGVFEIEDGSGRYEVSGYFLEEPDDVVLTLLAVAHGAQPFVISEIPETDWVAHVRRELAPVRAGRFFLYGSHDADKIPEDAVALRIDAAMAFGTGHHGTTSGCLSALDALASEGYHFHNSVDIGCGTAVLAMAAAKLWPEPVLASDIDPVAVETANANVALNDLAGRVSCVEAAGFHHPALEAAAPFDLIFANILKAPLIALAPDMAKNCSESGVVILSGLLNEQAEDVIAAYKAQGFVSKARKEFGEWTTLVMSRS
ncbi:50S ribosomal protein L11 methyltransferase [Thioclava sp. BHET1]|uniref:Ribosomal protein L11 methyltransferase n=1 Tax=Thioclava dalianensis TaxID=1185766 RepID=A0A074T8F1_9RHOB|nr:50S ribosomal protein L11 methyltransferase [Thioclava dalianensis]KEP68081.1 ribosomal protein L11 methyltransferase [Thioclava dalianensis]TMV94768.1 50S ribosomal protein L11 methyltransferase [Thioclava sp. BHET1]SFM90720.1 ribosomal protein L11 methyltransferase [Thioclava dalianensis]